MDDLFGFIIVMLVATLFCIPVYMTPVTDDGIIISNGTNDSAEIGMPTYLVVQFRTHVGVWEMEDVDNSYTLGSKVSFHHHFAGFSHDEVEFYDSTTLEALNILP